jgi:hypothetical protein
MFLGSFSILEFCGSLIKNGDFFYEIAIKWENQLERQASMICFQISLVEQTFAVQVWKTLFLFLA